MKSQWVSFYCETFVAIWVSKILRPDRQAFVNILRRLLHVACMGMTGKRRSGPDIWPETPHQGTGTEEMILII